VTLCDTGPLVALLNRGDADHTRCLATLEALSTSELVTTWPCLTEAMYLLGRVGGLFAQDRLWSYVANRLVSLHVPAAGEWERMRALMRQYGDAPMDLADASLVTAAERLSVQRVFTLDRHFRGYRIGGANAFEVVP
jgi:predicted nucleic acid-binding protein